MKPIKKTITIQTKKEIWDCGWKEHHHLTESTAVKCMKQRPSPWSEKYERRIAAERNLKERNLEIVRLALSGVTLTKLGERFSLSPSQVGYVFHKWLRRVYWYAATKKGIDIRYQGLDMQIEEFKDGCTWLDLLDEYLSIHGDRDRT